MLIYIYIYIYIYIAFYLYMYILIYIYFHYIYICIYTYIDGSVLPQDKVALHSARDRPRLSLLDSLYSGPHSHGGDNYS